MLKKIITLAVTSFAFINSLNAETIYSPAVTVTGGGEDERWVVDLDMEFAGTVYPKIKFGVDNREDLTSDVLLNREIMSIMNVMINARRKYVVTTKFSVEEK